MNGGQGGNQPGDDGKEYSSFGAVIDLTAASESTCKRAARSVRVVTAGGGALTLFLACEGRVVERAFTALTDGEDLDYQITAIKDGASVSKIRVTW